MGRTDFLWEALVDDCRHLSIETWPPEDTIGSVPENWTQEKESHDQSKRKRIAVARLRFI